MALDLRSKRVTEIDSERIHVIVRGMVQGVNFRAYTFRAARVLGLTGWVRNKPDRTVEVQAEGPREQLQALIDFLHVGSPSASVSAVEVTWMEASQESDSFEVRYF
jgi:acylphosphatase